MKPLPIRMRLTLWYFAVLAAGLLIFSFLVLAALNQAVHRSVDVQLREHMTAVRGIVGEDENRDPDALRHDLNEDAELAPDVTLMEVWDPNGTPMYRSFGMDRMQAPNFAPPPGNNVTTMRWGRHPLRMLVEKVNTGHGEYTVLVAIPIHIFLEAVHEVQALLWIAVPLLLIAAAAGGYWIAGRAIAPVNAMIAAAESIGPGDLSTRLAVPPAVDELHRLALTLNRMLDRLQSGFERITRFTADASHELRTPIAMLRTRAEVLLRRPRSPEEYRAAFEADLDELERTSALIEHLMLLARADAGAETLHFSDVDLAAIVRDTSSIACALAESQDVTCSVAVPENPVRVRGDERALRRLVLVLIDNAVKYTPARGTVHVGLQSIDGDAVLEVSDSGIGISERDLPHIFERFYRADQARSRATGGAGLGLSIGQWIAERHNASIHVSTEAGAGSTFRVTLARIA